LPPVATLTPVPTVTPQPTIRVTTTPTPEPSSLTLDPRQLSKVRRGRATVELSTGIFRNRTLTPTSASVTWRCGTRGSPAGAVQTNPAGVATIALRRVAAKLRCRFTATATHAGRNLSATESLRLR